MAAGSCRCGSVTQRLKQRHVRTRCFHLGSAAPNLFIKKLEMVEEGFQSYELYFG